MARPSVQRLSGIGFGECSTLHPLFAAFCLTRQDQCLLVLPAFEHGTGAVIEQEQHRQVERGDVLQIAAQQPRLQARSGGCTSQQIGGQALIRQRQASREAGPAGSAVVLLTKNQQAIE